MELKQVKSVIFDMDGLMLDTEKIYYQANQRTADQLGLDFSYEFYQQYIGGNHLVFFQDMIDKFGEEQGQLFINESEALLEDLLLNGQVDLKEGLLELLKYLDKNDIPMVVASSSHTDLVEQLLKNANIKHYFQELIGGDQVSESKPNPEIFLKAYDLLATNKVETLVLEDSLNGVRAAYNAGLPVIIVPDLFKPTAESKGKVIKECSNLLEVKNFIQSIK